MLATALSSLLVGIFHILEGRYHTGAFVYLGIVGLLSLPALGGLLQGIVMRGFLRGSTLWGALTGGGIVIAIASVAVLFVRFHETWWPVAFLVTVWIAKTLGVVPSGFVQTVFASVLFGLILGAVQALALGPSWRRMAAWTATSMAAVLPAGLWLYAWAAVEPVSSLFAHIAELIPLTGQWRYLPISVLWAEVAALCFALPTGLMMQQLLRRHQRADAEALVRRFE